jgi:hypothetical protein
MAHMMPNVYAMFEDRHVNNYMGASAQKHTVRCWPSRNDYGLGWRWPSRLVATAEEERVLGRRI